jgi:dTDP-4-dehydrorhamnose reductase
MSPSRGDGRWVVVGAAGMLGREVVAALAGRDVVALTRDTLDITDPVGVSAAVDGADVVVNCAAWTAVDDAETHEPEAHAVNATGAANLASACATSGSWLVQVSTDYVFAGDATTPYAEDAPLAPRSAYGRTKAAGELAVRAILPDRSLVLRTAWLYGAHGPSFVRAMCALEAARDTIDVVDDQRGQPTWSADVAARIVESVDRGVPAGVYHATASGETTWFGLARRLFELLGADPGRVQPTTSDRFPGPAPRPSYSVLGHDAWTRVGRLPLRQWDVALTAAWDSIGDQLRP